MAGSHVRKMLAAGTAMAGLLLLTFSASALAAHGRTGAAAGQHQLMARLDHRIFGIVPSGRSETNHRGRPTAREFAGTGFASTNNLSYHGGPVMQTNTTYAIYWEPPGYSGGLSGTNPDFSGPYQTLINQFLGDVAAAQNSISDVYAVDTQYYSGSSSSPSYISNSSSFAGSWVDTTSSLPGDQCSSEYSGSGVTPSSCVTDTQLQAEVSRAIAANGWTPGPHTLFFVFTPRNMGSCFDTTSGECAYTYYCAYHSNFTDSLGREVLYANQPYTETNSLGAAAAGACASGQYPNNDEASDSTINVMSHEHNETITDPLGTAWYDGSGNEIGDKCAWNFGTALGSTASGQYNQVIDGHDYYVQQEWSNASSGCALKYGTAPPQPSLSLSISPGSFIAGGSASGTVSVPSAPSSPVTVSLSATGSGSLSTTSVTIPAGSTTSGSFTYTDTKAETATITASASGYNNASQSETSTAGSAYSITGISPSSASVGIGGVQTFSASATDQYGNPTSALGGVAWSLSPSTAGTLSSTSGGSTTFTASAAGSATLTATLPGSTSPSASGSASITMTQVANAIANGGFESGSLSGWTKSGFSGGENVVSKASGYTCYGGNYCAMLGLTSPTNGSSNIAQTFAAPSASSSVSFYYEMACDDTVQYDWATATLKDVTANKTVTVLPKVCANNGWVKVSHSVTAGHKYTLTLTNHDDNYPGDPTYTLFDNVSVQ